MGCIAGVDIGGTKLAVTVAQLEGETLTITGKRKFPTPAGDWQAALSQLEDALGDLLDGRTLDAIGVSCGGPLDSEQGVILSPPNLPGWDRVPVCQHFSQAFGAPCYLQNDADACALAEWRFGAGRGCRHMVFLTFGTGLGAGLILNGQLYSGAANLAGELGHCRSPLDGSPYAPVGYGKAGSFEGFCSGGGIAELGRSLALEQLQQGKSPAFCPTLQDLGGVTALSIAQAAQEGDPTAREVYRCSGRHLGMALALLCDLLNPQRVVIGSIYQRSQELLGDAALEALAREALPGNGAACQVVPAALGDRLGDTAALSVAVNGLGRQASDILFAPGLS